MRCIDCCAPAWYATDPPRCVRCEAKHVVQEILKDFRAAIGEAGQQTSLQNDVEE